jgi:lipid-binding SYLF domain-containing protein
MKKINIYLLALFVLALLVPNISIATEVKDYSKSIDVFRESPQVQPFFANSYGYTVFPVIGKGAFVIGGAYGKGQVYRDNKVTGITRLVKASIGLQIGGKSFSQIIFFEDKRAYDEFTSGEFGLDAEAAAVIIVGGGSAQTGSSGTTAGESGMGKMGQQAEGKYSKGLAIFVRQQGGLMFEASIAGQKFSFKPL